MKVPAKGKYGDHLHLGVQTNKGHAHDVALWKANQWAPSAARSFTIINFTHTDYHGNPSPEETGYANIEVAYFSIAKEGEHVVNREMPYPPTGPKPT